MSATFQGRADRPAPELSPRRGVPMERWRVLPGVLLMATLGLITIGRRCFWLDEAYTWALIRQPTFADFVRGVSSNGGNKFGYLLLSRWWSMGGEGEAWLRIPSLAFAVGTVVCTHGVARRVYGPQAGLIAGLLAGASVPLLFYGVEARGYAMLAFFAALSWWLLLRALDHDDPWSWIGVGVAAFGALSAHLVGAMLLPALGLAVVLHRPVRAALVRCLPLGGAGLVALIIVVLADERRFPFPPPVSIRAVARAVRFLLGDHGAFGRDGSGFVIMAAYLVTLLAAAVLLGRDRPDRRSPQLLMWIWLVVPGVATLVYSLIGTPLLWSRTVIGSLPAVIIVAAGALGRIPTGWLRWGAVGVIVVAGLVRTAVIANDDVWEFDDLASVLVARENYDPDEILIFVQPYERRGLDYYFRHDPATFVATPPLGVRFELDTDTSANREVVTGLQPGQRVLLIDAADQGEVWRGAQRADHEFQFAEVESWLPSGATMIEQFDVGRMRVRVYTIPIS